MRAPACAQHESGGAGQRKGTDAELIGDLARVEWRAGCAMSICIQGGGAQDSALERDSRRGARPAGDVVAKKLRIR